MKIDLSRAIVIDQHCHAIREGYLQMDEISLRRCFTESRSLKMIEQHVQYGLHYMDMLNQLGRVFDVHGERHYLELRQTMREYDHINCLFDDASLGAFIVDDAFATGETMSLRKMFDLCRRPIYRCLRLETILESAIAHAESFQELMTVFAKSLAASYEVKTVAFKSICAYRGGLTIDHIVEKAAAEDFANLKKEMQRQQQPLRIERRPIYHYALLDAFELAGQLNFPVQIHTGIGDSDEDLREANPLCMRELFESKRFSQTQFVLLHCYPFVREAAYLAAIYPNVYMDLSLAAFLASTAMEEILHEALSAAPSSKILAASDGHSTPETHWFGCLSLKRSLSNVLDRLVGRGYITVEDATGIAGRVLHGNARRLYSLEGLV
ncbi:MAG TPA: amidohydrolase family protein [Candidatus Obscuribacterales bacterium]